MRRRRRENTKNEAEEEEEEEEEELTMGRNFMTCQTYINSKHSSFS